MTYAPINNTTGIEVNEILYKSPAELVGLLKNKVSTNPLVRVLIRADKEVKYEYMRQLLEAVGASGVSNVTFSVVDKDKPGAKHT